MNPLNEIQGGLLRHHDFLEAESAMQKVFQVGFNRCGTQFISKLFNINGYRSINWAGGRLGEDIYYSSFKKTKPLLQWADDYDVFCNMESVHNLNLPMCEGFKKYEYLDNNYNNAIFVLNTRNVDDWINSRLSYKNGDYSAFHAAHHGVKIADIADIWRRDWEEHVTNCKKYFSNRNEFIEIDIDRYEEVDYIDVFKRWFRIETVPPLPSAKVHMRRRTYSSEISKLIGREKNIGVSSDIAKRCAQQISAQCTALKGVVIPGRFSSWSNLMISGTIGSGRFYDKGGNQVPITSGQSGYFYYQRWHDKAMRAVGVLNDIVALELPWAADLELTIDMQDARLLGGDPTNTPPKPTISYCRRVGAKNVFLWPLPEYHSIGTRNFVSSILQDDIEFKDKRDQLVWRGNLSGHCSDVASGIFNHATYLVSKDILADYKDGKGISKYAELLKKNVRFRTVNNGYGDPNYNFRLTPSPQGREALIVLGKEHLLDNYRTDNFFHGYKYILSMRGFDTGSNFISAANTNSVVLKEEDGWEVFYTSLFKPWVHYIPLRAGCPDILEKLEWARSNPSKCEDISQNARLVCGYLMDKNLRYDFLRQTLQAYKEF